ncbi:putative bifunctional diguanylate cyclase/phosphodiesterase [Rhizorhapis sp. SPR117]|uniref:putative bifunctional diguanylate cyclase/phosphodiesterase n=1 Tax=Rhizorhapis sp. SPR117 TaxID=2912611 RepID=UPI001F307EC5|nr:EAL domain-containing protein [Rhizorhapis sp. SPR117]
MGFSSSSNVDIERLRIAQLRSINHVSLVYSLLISFAVIFTMGLFVTAVSLPFLTLWGLVALTHGFLYYRSGRARAQSDYADVTSATVLRDGGALFIQGLIWAIPPVMFARTDDPTAIISLWALMSCMMVGTALTYVGMPLSTLLFLATVGSANAWMMLGLGSPHVAAVVVCYALLLLVTSLKHARSFGTELTATTQLAEKSEVVSLLLREFEDSSADWLWQTDAARRVTHVSSRFARALGMEAADVEGKPLLQIFAGSAWESGKFSPTLHEFAERIKRRESFSNVVLEVEIAGQKHWWELSAAPRLDEKGSFQGFRGVGSDVTKQRESSEKIAQLAHYDTLTNLPNRLHLTESLLCALQEMEKWNSRCGFLMIDLDRFKAINDTLGHPIGDHLLARVSERLRHVCSTNEICARIGGDEFAVVIREIHDTEYVERLSLEIIDTLSRPYEIDQHTLYIGASVGSAIAPRDGRTPETLIRSADLALYRSKEEGGGLHHGYEPKLHLHAEERRVLEIALREALQKEQLHVVYQPVVDAKDGRILGFEALVRWTHPEMGSISPVKFIPVAEDARLIGPIGEWVLRTACKEAKNWPEHIRVAVNVSAEQLGDPNFVTAVTSALAYAELPPHRLELEVTESVFMREGTGAEQLLDRILALGVKLSLDDFGTGYSSLGYLRKSRFSTIKIDRSFVQGAAKNVPESIAIIRAVVAMADSLGMSTTAEGVENEEEVEMINRLGCRKIQGYYFGRPMPASEAVALFGNGQQSAVA